MSLWTVLFAQLFPAERKVPTSSILTPTMVSMASRPRPSGAFLSDWRCWLCLLQGKLSCDLGLMRVLKNSVSYCGGSAADTSVPAAPALAPFSPSVSSALPLGISEFLFTMYLVKEGIGSGSWGCGWESTSWLLHCLWLCFLIGQPGQGSCEFCGGFTEGLMTELLAGP